MTKNIHTRKDTVLLRPRVTEKAAILSSGKNVYAFEVRKDATKRSIIASIKDAYGITPAKVRMLSMPKKHVFVRGKWGTKGGGKKAYVFLKEGEKIEIM